VCTLELAEKQQKQLKELKDLLDQLLHITIGDFEDTLHRLRLFSGIGSNGTLLNIDADYHDEDHVDCINLADNFREFNKSSINSLPGAIFGQVDFAWVIESVRLMRVVMDGRVEKTLLSCYEPTSRNEDVPALHIIRFYLHHMRNFAVRLDGKLAIVTNVLETQQPLSPLNISGQGLLLAGEYDLMCGEYQTGSAKIHAHRRW